MATLHLDMNAMTSRAFCVVI